ncbi:MAG TPA: DUF3829 domain-containing protein [Rhabdaerophilum sp.]|nr:DUF3829 domain-containing protein [Rhabdaerophilum sp.]
MTTRRFVLAALVTTTFAAPLFPARAQTPLPADKRAELNALIAKNNAYIGLLNRTMRAKQSWERYTSWVNVEKGPTGRERYITYGLYSLYDVRSEIQKALDAAGKAPKVDELDRAIERFVGAYETLAPLIDRAERYYERKDYKSDNMAEGRELHARLVPAAREFLKEDVNTRQLMKLFAGRVAELELAAIEMEEGRKARWQMKRVQIAARQAMDLLPNRENPIVDMPAFSSAVAEYGKVVREFDDFMRANPDSGATMRDRPGSLLGKLREYEEELQRARGDARRARGQGTTWIVNEYNMMISMSQMFR